MRLLVCLLLFAFAAVPQDSGRDTGEGPPPVIFVRWQRSAETKEIYDTAWRALEPFDFLTRRRLLDFESSEKRAGAVLAQHADAALVVAFGEEAADAARRAKPDRPVLEISPGKGAHVLTRVDRARFARILRRFHPRATKVRARGALPGFEATASGAADLVWVAEREDPPPGEKGLVVSTSERLRAGAATLTVRPDPVSAGLKVAALVLSRLRDGKELRPASAVARLRVTIDLGAARAAGYRVPLVMLARADVVRRAP